MYIRLATTADISYITHALARKAINYIKPSTVREDIIANRLYVVIENEKPIAQCALVTEVNYNYTAMKRMVIYRKENCGRGLADMLIEHFSSMNLAIGATPWAENERIKHILRKHGFEYQYTFSEKYEFFLKNPLTN
jgi:N-acetylglutamate synthase-like GNAT family acetyltransferase